MPHHVAHAASAALAAPFGGDTAVLVLDGRGERHSHLAGIYRAGVLEPLYSQSLPHSLGLLYEDATAHLGFLRSSDEFKVMALASYGTPRHLEQLRELVHATGDGGFATAGVDWNALAKKREPGETFSDDDADLAASLQAVTEEVLLDLARWLHERTGAANLAMAGGVALNCVANTRIFAETPFEQVWVQPAAGDAGTALGGALAIAQEAGDGVHSWPGRRPRPRVLRRADRGRAEDRAGRLRQARPTSPPRWPQCLADNGIVAWFQGRSEFGPRALGHRSLLAHPGHPENLARINDVKGREQFRPVAPMVRLSRAAEMFSRGPIPSPYMLFVHDVAPQWKDRIPTVVHVDGTARMQTVDESDPLLDRMLARFEELTGLPVVVNTSLNTAGRPMVDDIKDALECFGATPVDLLAIGGFVLRRAAQA